MFSRKGRIFLSILFALFFFLPRASWAGDFDFAKDLRSSISRTANNYLSGASGQISTARNMLYGAIPSAAAVPGLVSNAVIGTAMNAAAQHKALMIPVVLLPLNAVKVAQSLPVELPARVDTFQKEVRHDATCFVVGGSIDVLSSGYMPYEIKREGMGLVSGYERGNSDGEIKKFILDKVGSSPNLVNDDNKAIWNDHNVLVLQRNPGQNSEIVTGIDNAFDVIPAEHKLPDDMIVTSVEPAKNFWAQYNPITSVITINENNPRNPIFKDYMQNGLTSHERSVFHEYAHFLTFNKRINPHNLIAFNNLHSADNNRNSFAREYGRTNADEDFATMYEQYLSDSSALTDPSKYQTLTNAETDIIYPNKQLEAFQDANGNNYLALMTPKEIRGSAPSQILRMKTNIIAGLFMHSNPGTQGDSTYTFAMGNNGITRKEVPFSQVTNTNVLANRPKAFGGGEAGIRGF